MTTGRNFDEILRVLDSLQLTANHRMSTPANWKQGEDVFMTGAITDDEARKLYPAGWKQPKSYIVADYEPAFGRNVRRSAPPLYEWAAFSFLKSCCVARGQ